MTMISDVSSSSFLPLLQPPSLRRCQCCASPLPAPSLSQSQLFRSSPRWGRSRPAPNDLRPRQPLPPPLLVLLPPPPCSPTCLCPRQLPSFPSSCSHRSDQSTPFCCLSEDVPSSLIRSCHHRRRRRLHHPTRARRGSGVHSDGNGCRLHLRLRRRSPLLIAESLPISTTSFTHPPLLSLSKSTLHICLCALQNVTCFCPL